ncbi:MAG: hypothetical protein JW841_05795 [Deltaproteobacteria bacterium]|nr:hypothetical protein [Deltaproteobacteria bacterium]
MKRIDCQKCQELLEQKWDGDALNSNDLAAMSDHVEQCSSCKEYQLNMNSVLELSASLKEVELEREVVFSPLVLQPRNTRSFFAGVLATSTVAAVFMLGLFVGGVFNNHQSPVNESQIVRLVIPAANAKQVEIVGDFTNWKNRIALTPAENGMWVGELKVPPGRYKYMIVIDGKVLQPDPAAREVVDDGFGGKNSVLDVGSI